MADTLQDTELLIIGAGPGGYAAAFRAADLGMQVTLVDPEPIPVKQPGLLAVLIHMMRRWMRKSAKR